MDDCISTQQGEAELCVSAQHGEYAELCISAQHRIAERLTALRLPARHHQTGLAAGVVAAYSILVFHYPEEATHARTIARRLLAELGIGRVTVALDASGADRELLDLCAPLEGDGPLAP